MYTYLYSGLFFIGLLLMYFAIKQYQKTSRLLSLGIRAEAEVVAFKTVLDGEGDTYKPVLEYSDMSRTKRQFTSAISSAKPAFKIGQKVKIVFSSEDSGDVKIDSFWGLFRWSVVLLTIASPFLIIGGSYLLYILRQDNG